MEPSNVGGTPVLKIALSAESTIDLDQSHLTRYDIHTLPFHVQKGDEEGFDFKFKNEDLFAFTNATGTLCHTSACNVDELQAHFKRLFDLGYEKILHFTISSGLSSGYSNANVAADNDPRILVIDSHATSGGIALQAIYARQLLDQGMGFEDVYAKVLARRKDIECSFQLDRLDFLYKGGRCSKLALIGANILRIKPEIVCDAEGHFALGAKHRGSSEKCTLEYIDNMISHYPNADKSLVFLDYSTMSPELIKKCEERCSAAGFKEIQTYQACPTNSYHAGPNVIGIHFYEQMPEK
jgi:DegV family protein with EDD domain